MPAMKKKVEKTTQSLKSFGHLSEKGLSLLVQQCLGLPLDKTYQLSDWEQRPLLTQQIEYAGENSVLKKPKANYQTITYRCIYVLFPSFGCQMSY